MSEPWNQGVRGTQVLPLINLDAETIRVESGPGTGKTFGLVRRVERILHPDGLNVSGKEVLIVAFNRVIAKQLRSEVERRLPSSKERPGPTVRTIHGLCVQLVGEDVRLLLPHEREAMLYDVLHAFPPLKRRYKAHKKADIALLEHEARNADHHDLWQAVNLWLGRHKARLVSDLPGLVLDKMKGGDLANEGYLHVVVDEFQDLTPGEQALVFELRVEGGQLVALGDPRQSIYRFRGNDPAGLDKLDDLADESGDGEVIDVVMTECQRCPAPIVRAANRLMSLSSAKAMVPVSTTTANLHVVHWPSPAEEAAGMARFILENQQAHPKDQHLVMVTRRQFGYALRDQIAAINKDVRVDLAFSEGLLETWAVREAFLLLCLLLAPDRPTWRAWLAYENSSRGREYKAAQRNAGAYLKLLETSNDRISAHTTASLQ